VEWAKRKINNKKKKKMKIKKKEKRERRHHRQSDIDSIVLSRCAFVSILRFDGAGGSGGGARVLLLLVKEKKEKKKHVSEHTDPKTGNARPPIPP
jgi:hypothetical protein